MVRPSELLGRPGRRMQKFTIGEVRTVEWVWSDATHKVESRKSPGRVGLLQTSAGGYFIPNISYNVRNVILD